MIKEIAKKTKIASQDLARKSAEDKNFALLKMSEALKENISNILKANAIDLSLAITNQMSIELQDRLKLDENRIISMADGLVALTKLSEPINQVLDTFTNKDGLLIHKVSVPIGVIAMIYESRPNVTVDACGLALKSGNAVVLRGSSSAYETNKTLVDILKRALEKTKISSDIIGFIDSKERSSVGELLSLNGLIDLAIPRGGKGLIDYVIEVSKVPVIETGVGNCHLYIDEFANLEKGVDILLNGKVQRPSVCNALETLLVHEKVAGEFFKKALFRLDEEKVRLYGCEKSRVYSDKFYPVTDELFKKEFLGLELAVKVVDSLEEAITHIVQYSTGHSESIVTENITNARIFTNAIDSACVYVNASTRFSDGEQFGFGAEIGISTQKMHSRGPMGLEALTSYKYIILGDGQIRQ